MPGICLVAQGLEKVSKVLEACGERIHLIRHEPGDVKEYIIINIIKKEDLLF